MFLYCCLLFFISTVNCIEYHCYDLDRFRLMPKKYKF